TKAAVGGFEMNEKFLSELSARLAALAADNPAKDLEKNVRALLSSALARLDLVSREEYEIQSQVLARAREKLAALETRVAVRAALSTARFEFPAGRVTVSLAPADLPKESGRFDLPIALGILAATGQVPKRGLGALEFAGELALSGELRPIRGALAMTLGARREGRAFVLPESVAAEAALATGARILPARSLLDVCA